MINVYIFFILIFNINLCNGCIKSFLIMQCPVTHEWCLCVCVCISYLITIPSSLLNHNSDYDNQERKTVSYS